MSFLHLDIHNLQIALSFPILSGSCHISVYRCRVLMCSSTCHSCCSCMLRITSSIGLFYILVLRVKLVHLRLRRFLCDWIIYKISKIQVSTFLHMVMYMVVILDFDLSFVHFPSLTIIGFCWGRRRWPFNLLDAFIELYRLYGLLKTHASRWFLIWTKSLGVIQISCLFGGYQLFGLRLLWWGTGSA